MADMMKKKEFINASAPSITTYEYKDVISGRGYVDFYPVTIGGEDRLVTSQEYMQEGQYIFGTSSSNTIIYEKTFVTQMGSTRIMQGEAIISCPWGSRDVTNNHCTVTATIYVNDTQIATASEYHTWSTNNDGIGSYASVLVDIPKTKIKAGDLLKVKIKFETNSVADFVVTWISPYPKINKYETLTYTMGRTVVICSIPFLVQE